jgi:hypothetical protein
LKRFALSFLIWLAPWSAFADQLSLSWQPVPGATGYTVYQTVDGGASWQVLATATSPPVLVDVVGDRLVLFRVGATRGPVESLQESRGAWYNGSLRGWPTGVSIQ